MYQKNRTLCLITDRQALPAKTSLNNALSALTELCREAARAGVDMIQVREKDLSAQHLCQLTAAIIAAVKPYPTRVLVNDRIDIALACGAHGVHLPANSLPVEYARKLAGNQFIIGVSTHSLAEVRAADEAGAGYILFGPVFDTPSKRAFGAPQGLDRLKEAVQAAKCPVLALGGIDRNNIGGVLAAGAGGIAAIRLFAESEDLQELVYALKQ